MTGLLETPFAIKLVADADLIAVLDALSIPYIHEHGRSENHSNLIFVEMDVDIDGRLEHLIGRLSDMRWSYQPGRTIQVELPGLAAFPTRGRDAHRSS